MRWRRWLAMAAAVFSVAAIALAIATWQALMPLPASLRMGAQAGQAGSMHFVAADGTPLNLSFDERFNHADVLPLNRIPALLRKAFWNKR